MHFGVQKKIDAMAELISDGGDELFAKWPRAFFSDGGGTLKSETVGFEHHGSHS